MNKFFLKLKIYFARFHRAYTPQLSTALYVKDDAIGDFLFGTAMIRELQEKFKDVYVVCAPNVRSIAELYLPPERIISAGYRFDDLKKIFNLQPSLVVTSSLRSSYADQIAAFFNRRSRGEVTIVSTDDPAFKKRRRARTYTRLGAHPPDEEIDSRFLCGAHRKEHFLLETAFEMTLDPSRSRPFLPTEKLPRAGDGRLNGNYFCVLPSTGDVRRTYRQGDLMKLAKQYAARTKWPAVFLSADSIPELSRQNAGSQEGGELIDLTKKTSIVESLGIISRARFTLTNETGLGHASWIMGRPTVMIMPGGNFHHFHSSDKSLHAVYDLRECFDCHHHCRYSFNERFPCIDEIPFEKIEAAITNICSSL